MKKILALSIVLIMAFTLSAHTEPFVMLALASPSLVFSRTGMSGECSIEELENSEAMFFSLPDEVMKSGISLSDMTSDNIMKAGKTMLDLAFLISGLDNSEVLEASGSVVFQPDADENEGRVSLDIIYDDVSLLYRFGSRTDSTRLDGKVRIEFLFFEKPLVVIRISSEDMLINGNPSYYKEEMDVEVWMNEELVSAYMAYRDADMEAMHREVASELSPHTGMTEADILAFASSHDSLDLLDALSFLSLASRDDDLDELEILSLLISPRVVLNGVVQEDIQLGNLMNLALGIDNLVSSFE